MRFRSVVQKGDLSNPISFEHYPALLADTQMLYQQIPVRKYVQDSGTVYL